MMKKALWSILVASLMVVGCAPKMEVFPGSVKNSKYAPTNQKDEPGIVSYDQGDEEMEEEAYKMMYNACGGKYKILDKDVKHISDAIIGLDTKRSSGLIMSDDRVYVKFICK